MTERRIGSRFTPAMNGAGGTARVVDEHVSTPRTAALKTKIAQTIRMLQLLNDSIESVERGNPKTDKCDCDLREVATLCGDLRVELATFDRGGR